MTNKLTKPFSLATCGRATAERYTGQPTMDVISIYSPGWTQAALQEGWRQVTFIGMNDDHNPEEHNIRRIVMAALDAIRDSEGLLVHCEMGMSRSVGVAYALSDWFGIPYSNSFKGNAQIRRAVLYYLNKLAEYNPSLITLYHDRLQ